MAEAPEQAMDTTLDPDLLPANPVPLPRVMSSSVPASRPITSFFAAAPAPVIVPATPPPPSLPTAPPGLVNLGNTCYFNSVMQVLFHIPQFRVLLHTFHASVVRLFAECAPQIIPQKAHEMRDMIDDLHGMVVHMEKLYRHQYRAKPPPPLAFAAFTQTAVMPTGAFLNKKRIQPQPESTTIAARVISSVLTSHLEHKGPSEDQSGASGPEGRESAPAVGPHDSSESAPMLLSFPSENRPAFQSIASLRAESPDPADGAPLRADSSPIIMLPLAASNSTGSVLGGAGGGGDSFAPMALSQPLASSGASDPALDYADEDVWMDSNAFAPHRMFTHLKRVLGLGQHDAQEWLRYILNAIDDTVLQVANSKAAALREAAEATATAVAAAAGGGGADEGSDDSSNRSYRTAASRHGSASDDLDAAAAVPAAVSVAAVPAAAAPARKRMRTLDNEAAEPASQATQPLERSPPPPIEWESPSAWPAAVRVSCATGLPDLTNVVEDLFAGRSVSMISCVVCGAVTKREEAFHDISVAIEPGVSLCWALCNYTKTERLDGSNKYSCEACIAQTEAARTIRLARLPPVVTVHLNRFTFNDYGHSVKLNVHVPAPRSLRFQQWCTDDCPQRATPYELFGIVVHSGGSSGGGHYYSYIRTLWPPPDVEGMGPDAPAPAMAWFAFDDSEVRQVSDDTVEALLSPAVATRTTSSAYVLFYRAVEQ